MGRKRRLMSDRDPTHLSKYPDSMKRSHSAPAILDINGTRDEAIGPKIVDAHREVMAPYARRYRVARVEGAQHYLYKQESIKLAGALWLRFIESGYFDK